MAPEHVRAFAKIPQTAQGHFMLCLYAAVHRLLERLAQACAGDSGDDGELFARFPFLADYYEEMRRHMPADVSWAEGVDWWRRGVLAWEREIEAHLPLRALAAAHGVSFEARLALMIAGLVEEDARFGGLFEQIQEPAGSRRPTLQLVGQTVAPAEWDADAWSICGPLIDAGVLDVADQDAPRAEWLLRVPPFVWSAARGDTNPNAGRSRLRAAASFAPLRALVYPPAFLERVCRVPALLASGALRSVIVRAPEGSDALEVLGGIARTLGRSVLVVEGAEAATRETAALLGPFCTMTGAMPVLAYELGPGETTSPPVGLAAGPVGIALGTEGGVAGDGARKAVTIALPIPDRELRTRQWRESLADRVGDPAGLAAAFHVPGHYIRQLAEVAAAEADLDGRRTVSIADAREASRSLNRQLLDTLASRLDASGAWDDLVASDATFARLLELERRCRHRETILTHVGPLFGNGANDGVRALFTGASGTGKTMAARILAAELGMDLYRVDLAAVVNKYIGETEKNLNRVLSRAEALDVVLLLDEGDALLGQRTSVRSAHDRYANLETNYLLQRLEHYRGIVIVTTNLGDNIDAAFQRRMDVVVPFFPPGADERLRILLLHLPDSHAVDAAYLHDVARRCPLTGAQIRNATLHAALIALDDESPVGRGHLEAALRSEFRKAGGTFPLEPEAQRRHPDGGMSAFVAALEGQ